MTLQLRKKHQTTALTLSRAIRTSAAILLASLPGLAIGQAPGSNGSFRPVPKFGTQTQQPSRAGGSQPEGWNLQWRQSRRGPQARNAVRNQFVVQQHIRLQQAADAPGRTYREPTALAAGVEATTAAATRPESSAYGSGSRTVSSRHAAPRLANINQVNWQAPSRQNAGGETLIPPSPVADAKPNFFSDPFGDDPLPVQTPAAQLPASPQRLNPAPTGRGEQLIPPPAQPESEALMPSNELRSRPNLFESDSAQIEPLRKPEPPQSIPSPRESVPEPMPEPMPEPIPEPMPEPGFDLPEKAAEPNLGDHLRNERPDEPNRNETEEDLPAPENGMNLEEDENPFDSLGRGNDGEETGRDAQDRDRINSGDDADDSDDEGANVNDDDLRAPSATACADFRERIASQTIDQVSLDISPPYRPDEIDMDKYRELKQEFDEKQAFRDWRSVDGSPIAFGRLRDLAYEKAVIETSSGSLEELQLNRLSESDVAYIAENWGIPSECLLDQSAATPRNWVMTTMTWKASNVCHTPLYFQDVNLERYGHTHGPVLEPLVQTAHFFGNVIVLPYKMGVHSPHECQYPLGYYRPGNCAPWIKQPVPISAKGALTQAVTMTGLFWLIP